MGGARPCRPHLHQGLTGVLRAALFGRRWRSALPSSWPAGRAATTVCRAGSKFPRCCRRRAASSRSRTRSPTSGSTDALLDRMVGTGEPSPARRAARSCAARWRIISPPRCSCPTSMFRDAARKMRYDVEVLHEPLRGLLRAGLPSPDDAAPPGAEGIPFHFIRVDIAGNISKRFSASGIHIARFGAACPRWNVYDAFGTPGMLRVQALADARRQTFFCIARTTSRPTLSRDRRAAAPHRPARRRPRLRHSPRHRDRLRRRAQPRRPADHHADRRFLPHLPAHRLRRTRHAIHASALNRRERARPIDLRRGLTIHRQMPLELLAALRSSVFRLEAEGFPRGG